MFRHHFKPSLFCFSNSIIPHPPSIIIYPPIPVPFSDCHEFFFLLFPSNSRRLFNFYLLSSVHFLFVAIFTANYLSVNPSIHSLQSNTLGHFRLDRSTNPTYFPSFLLILLCSSNIANAAANFHSFIPNTSFPTNIPTICSHSYPFLFDHFYVKNITLYGSKYYLNISINIIKDLTQIKMRK
jgi:hypothetical protein